MASPGHPAQSQARPLGRARTWELDCVYLCRTAPPKRRRKRVQPDHERPITHAIGALVNMAVIPNTTLHSTETSERTCRLEKPRAWRAFNRRARQAVTFPATRTT